MKQIVHALFVMVLAGCGVKGGPTPYVETYPEVTPVPVVSALPTEQMTPTPSPIKESGTKSKVKSGNKTNKTKPKGGKR